MTQESNLCFLCLLIEGRFFTTELTVKKCVCECMCVCVKNAAAAAVHIDHITAKFPSTLVSICFPQTNMM